MVDFPIRDPADQRRTVVQATQRGQALVATLSTTIESPLPTDGGHLGQRQIGTAVSC